MNKEVILAVADAIEQDALAASKIKFDMTHYAEKVGCGTAACIAGWAFALFNEDGTRRTETLTAERLVERGYRDIPGHAAMAMGLVDEGGEVDYDLTDNLFAPDWLSQIRPADAAQTLRTLAETGDIVWNTEELEQRYFNEDPTGVESDNA